MVVIKNPSDYIFVRNEKSRTKNKKYDGIIRNKNTKKEKRVPYGDIRYQHYRDTTKLKLYSHLDHNDPKRRKNYKNRHEKTRHNKFSSSWFAYKYLW